MYIIIRPRTKLFLRQFMINPVNVNNFPIFASLFDFKDSITSQNDQLVSMKTIISVELMLIGGMCCVFQVMSSKLLAKPEPERPNSLFNWVFVQQFLGTRLKSRIRELSFTFRLKAKVTNYKILSKVRYAPLNWTIKFYIQVSLAICRGYVPENTKAGISGPNQASLGFKKSSFLSLFAVFAFKNNQNSK